MWLLKEPRVSTSASKCWSFQMFYMNTIRIISNYYYLFKLNCLFMVEKKEEKKTKKKKRIPFHLEVFSFKCTSYIEQTCFESFTRKDFLFLAFLIFFGKEFHNLAPIKETES